MQPIFINITGNICTGKTCLAGFLEKEFGWHPVYEDYAGVSYFNDFYSDMNKWAFHHQVSFLERSIYLQQEKIAPIMASKHGPSVVIHDNIFSAHDEVFARSMYEENVMSKKDFFLYKELVRRILKYFYRPDYVVYLKSDLGILIERIGNRERGEEVRITSNYLKRLGACFDEAVEKFDCPVLTIDCKKIDFVHNKDDKKSILAKVHQFIAVP